MITWPRGMSTCLGGRPGARPKPERPGGGTVSSWFVATSGMGEMIGIAGAERDRQRFDFSFDNHVLRVW